MIGRERLVEVLDSEGIEVSRSIAHAVRDFVLAGVIPNRPAEITTTAVRTAWQAGLEEGLRIAELDRIGAAELLEAITIHVQENDREAIEGSSRAAAEMLRALYR